MIAFRLPLATAGIATALFTVQAAAFTIALTPNKDNTLYEHTSGIDLSNGKGTSLFAGATGQTIDGIRRALLSFDLTSIPVGSTIDDATLALQLSKVAAPPLPPQSLDLHRMLESWGEGDSNAGSGEGIGAAALTGDATWRHRFFPSDLWASGHDGGNFLAMVSASTLVGNTLGLYPWRSNQLLADVQDWVNNPATNHGWLLRGGETTLRSAKRFDSKDNTALQKRPRLAVTFTPLEPLDHFLCYKAKNSLGYPKFTAGNVTLSDSFMATTTWQVFKPFSLCTPAAVNGGSLFDDDTHVEAYQLKALPQTIRPALGTVRVTNQFHMARPLVIDTLKLDRLLVPTTKCVDSTGCSNPQPLPDPNNLVDHYDCYTVKSKLGEPPFQAIQNVSVDDQFIDSVKTFKLLKPTHLCVVADKNGEGEKRPLYNLMCYRARKALGQPPHQKQKNLHTRNQFDEERIDTITEDELCVPSSIDS
jgi:hypothetical protein